MIVNLLLSHVQLPFLYLVLYRAISVIILTCSTFKQNNEIFIKKKAIDKDIHFIEVSIVITQLTTNN